MLSCTLRYKIYFTFIIFSIISSSIYAQTSVQNFGTGTGSHTSTTGSTAFLPNPTSGTTWARGGASTPNAPIVLANTPNPLSSAGSFVRGVASTTTSVSKFSPMVNYAASTQFYTSFKVLFGDSNGAAGSTIDGNWSFYQGAGSMYSDANNFATAQVFTGLQFTYSSGKVNLAYKYGSTTGFVTTGLTSTSFAQGVPHTVEIYGNNSAAPLSYGYYCQTRTVGVDKFDLYIDNVLVGDELSKATLPNGTNIVSNTFIGVSSMSNLANIFVDDVVVYNTLPTTSIAPEDNIVLVASSVSNISYRNYGCTDGFTYYQDPSNSSNFIFGIDWKSSVNDAARNAATISIEVNPSPLPASDNNSSTSVWAMSRIWNVNLNGQTLNQPVDVKFFYDPAEKTAVTDLTSAHAGTPDLFDWVKSSANNFTQSNLTSLGAINAYSLTATDGLIQDGVNYVLFTGISSFSGGTGVGSSGSSPLPIALKSLNAKSEGDHNLIEWVTSLEKDVKSYTVYRSEDGVSNWNELSSINSRTGNSSEDMKYAVIDYKPMNKTYYRVISTDIDGRVQKSKVVSVSRLNDNLAIQSVLPNPTSDEFYVAFQTRENSKVVIQLFDVNGSEVLNSTHSSIIGENKAKIDIHELKSGIYFGTIKQGNQTSETFRIVKE